MSRSCTRHTSSVGLVFVALSAAFACSGSEEGADDAPRFTPPPFGSAGGAAPAVAGENPLPGAAGPSSGPGGGVGSTQPAASAGASGVQAPVGAGGSAMAGGGTGGAGGAGEADVGSAGASMAAGGGSMVGEEPSVGPGGCGGATLFCEDFEALPAGPLQGVVNGLEPERAVSIVADPERGQVLQVQAGPTYGNKAGVFLDFAPPDNSYFGRLFARVAAFPDADSDHWVIVEATGAGSTEQVRPVGGQFDRWAPGSDGPSAQDWTDWQQSNAETVAGAWACVEWQMNGAGGGNDIVLWVDGEEVLPIDRGNFSFPPVDRLWFGWVVYQDGAPNQYDVRLDDIVLSTERIGCD